MKKMTIALVLTSFLPLAVATGCSTTKENITASPPPPAADVAVTPTPPAPRTPAADLGASSSGRGL